MQQSNQFIFVTQGPVYIYISTTFTRHRAQSNYVKSFNVSDSTSINVLQSLIPEIKIKVALF